MKATTQTPITYATAQIASIEMTPYNMTVTA
jgi:hypothetical protein